MAPLSGSQGAESKTWYKLAMTFQAQLNLFDDPPTLEELRKRREDQWFDRKSIRIESIALANAMIAFANADGGRIAIGIRDGQIEGVNGNPKHLNALMQAAIDHSEPPVRFESLFVDCINANGELDRVLILDIEASDRVHRNRRGECYLRIGDEMRRLDGLAERELSFDKHEAIFDDSIVPNLVYADLDLEALAEYAIRMGSSNVPTLLRSRHLYFDLSHRSGVTQAGQLLFGLVPPVWCYIRYLRYAGTTVETGDRSNLVEDIPLYGTIPSLIEQAKLLLNEKLRVSRLTTAGRFDRILILPEFAWLEAIVNAVTHRSYSLQGDGIRIRDFDDRLEVESPGRLPGLVRVQNIRNTRFSRNPHIARVLAEMTGYVRELNEGVQRMFEEMEKSGLRDPVYSPREASVTVTLFKKPYLERDLQASEAARVLTNVRRLEKRLGDEGARQVLTHLIARRSVSNREIADLLGVTTPTARGYLRLLEDVGLVLLRAKSSTDPTARWELTESPHWDAVETYLKAT